MAIDSFHSYSWGNVLLIISQRPAATQVAGYKTWESLGRHVKKGEKAIRIMAPSYYKREVENEQGEREERTVTYFRSVAVFDLAQTDGQPLPKVDAPVLQKQDGTELYVKLAGLAMAEGLRVQKGHERLEHRDSMMGFYEREQRLIALREAPQLQMTKTLAHELAHHYADHSRPGAAAETEAESVAYIVLARYGLDSGERSFPYVSAWAKDQQTLRAALGTIQRISQTIIGKLDPETAPS